MGDCRGVVKVSEYYDCLKSTQPILFCSILQEMCMPKPTIIQVIKSTLSAFIGVQSTSNRQQDFEQGSLTTYIIAGLVFTVIFVVGLVFLVSAVLK
jgi:hypothetical protein